MPGFPSLNQPPSSHGFTLIETMLAVAIFTVISTAVLSGISTTQISGAKTEEQSIAENLARNQMEDVFASPYLAPPAEYTAVTAPEGYSVTAIAEEYIAGDPNIERIVVTVTHHGVEVLVLETLRTNM